MSTKLSTKAIKQIEKTVGEKLTLGRLIWAIRMADEITQTEFADKLDISRQHLCDIEHNRKSISPSLAAKYAEKLSQPAEQFVRLSLQDLVDREGLDITVDIFTKRTKRGRGDGHLALA